MRRGQILPRLWLLSDRRNDAEIERVLKNASEPLGFVFRHYHLAPAERRARFGALRRVCRAREHLAILSGDAELARRWGADGIYGAPSKLAPSRAHLLRIATAHDLREIAHANRIPADAVMLSPVFSTRSHPGAATLGPARFRLLARHASVPVIALGGMNSARARQLAWPRWAAIDALSGAPAA